MKGVVWILALIFVWGRASFIVDSLLALLISKLVNCPASRLIHHPTDDGTVRRIVRRGPPPYVVEHVQRQFLSRFPIVDDAHYQSKNDSVRQFVDRLQRQLIALSDGSDRADPDRFGRGTLS